MQTNQVATEVSQKRILVGDTDNGKKIRENIKDLKDLIKAYRNGTLRQNQKN
jgi:fructose-1,6-bisphosphatase-3